MPHFDHFPRPGESDPYENIVATKLVLRGGDFCDRPLEAEGAEAPRSHARFRLFFGLPQKLLHHIISQKNVPVAGFRLFHFSDQLILCGNSVGGGGGVLDDSWSVGRAEAFEQQQGGESF